MRYILGDNYFSIEYFNDDGLFDVSYFTGIDMEEIEYEFSIGNFLIGQTHQGGFYFFCEASEIGSKEISYNEFKRLLAKN